MNALRTPPHWYVIAFILPVAYYFAATLLSSLLTATPTKLGVGPLAADSASAVVRLFLSAVGVMTAFTVVEEMGWRGFLLPRLQNNMTAFGASVWIAFIWTYWQFPYYMAVYKGDSFFGTLVLVGLLLPLAILPVTVLLTFAYNGSGGSLLVTMILHGTNNTAMHLFGLAGSEQSQLNETTPLVVAIPALMAMLVTRWYGRRNLAPRQRQIIE